MQTDNKNEKGVFKKPPFDSISTIMSTPFGRLHIRGPVNAGELEKYSLSEGLACFRAACRQHQALVELCRQPDGIVFTASLANKVISYVTFQKPDYPWWQTRCFPSLLELGSIETDPSWRKMGLTNALLGNIFNKPDFKYFDDYVVIAVQFIQSWDLKNTALTPWAYRQFMLDLFKKYDFVTWETVDPEIREHPCNVLLARVGCNLDVKTITFFTGCCLGTNQ
jgi:acetoin utilization protein AcuA